jgi:hypothetical protein
MALCTLYSKLVVSDAGRDNINGDYLPVTTTLGGYTYTKWVKDGAVNYPSIEIGTGGPYYYWIINGTIPYPGAPTYQGYPTDTTPTVTDVTQLVCPPTGEGAWYLAGSGLAPAPTVTGVPVAPAQPTFGLAADVVALITSRFGSVANFLRLRNQGQV